jgi:hypothetical protein
MIISGLLKASKTQTNPLKSSTAAFRYVPPNAWKKNGYTRYGEEDRKAGSRYLRHEYIRGSR